MKEIKNAIYFIAVFIAVMAFVQAIAKYPWVVLLPATVLGVRWLIKKTKGA